jgi:hypothetical protein
MAAIFCQRGLVPPSLWQFVEDTPYAWATGEFYTSGAGRILGVEFEVRGLPFADQIAPLLARTAPATEAATPAPRPQTNKGGRPPANWWPDFAVELALYVEKEGVPPKRRGAIDQVMRAVLDRMAEAGKGQPSPTQVRPTIKTVLERYWGETGQL